MTAQLRYRVGQAYRGERRSTDLRRRAELTVPKGGIDRLLWRVVWSPRGALPNVQRIHDKYRDRGFELVGVHSTEDGDLISEFAREHRVDWPLAVDVATKTESA